MRNCTVKMITVRTHEALGSSRFRSAALRGQDEEAKTHAATVSGIFRSRIAYYMQVAIFFSYINLSFASFCSIYGVMGTRAPCKTTPLISGLVG